MNSLIHFHHIFTGFSQHVFIFYMFLPYLSTPMCSFNGSSHLPGFPCHFVVNWNWQSDFKRHVKSVFRWLQTLHPHPLTLLFYTARGQQKTAVNTCINNYILPNLLYTTQADKTPKTLLPIQECCFSLADCK